MVGTKAKNKQTANEFADWIIREDGGQRVVKSFKNDGHVLYSPIPVGVDPLGRVKGTLGLSASVKAAIPLHWSEDEIYFFNERKYARINVIKDTISYDTEKEIWSTWTGLRQIGFAPINAAFVTPDNPDEAYFFCESRCAKINLRTDKVCADGGPFNIHEKWASLKDAGFDTVDATLSFAFKGKGHENVVCFFRHGRYAMIDVRRNVCLESGDFTSRFNALDKANFKSIDAVVFKPKTQKQQAYYFSGRWYILANLSDDHILYGPFEVSNEWKSLKAASFY